MRAAPRERDLATLMHAGVAIDADSAMTRAFELEWRLPEVWSFARWHQGPHLGDADDSATLTACLGTHPPAP